MIKGLLDIATIVLVFSAIAAPGWFLWLVVLFSHAKPETRAKIGRGVLFLIAIGMMIGGANACARTTEPTKTKVILFDPAATPRPTSDFRK